MIGHRSVATTNEVGMETILRNDEARLGSWGPWGMDWYRVRSKEIALGVGRIRNGETSVEEAQSHVIAR